VLLQVVIKYVPCVGDSKRAMDEYTSEIMMGGTNTIAMHNTCEVSGQDKRSNPAYWSHFQSPGSKLLIKRNIELHSSSSLSNWCGGGRGSELNANPS